MILHFIFYIKNQFYNQIAFENFCTHMPQGSQFVMRICYETLQLFGVNFQCTRNVIKYIKNKCFSNCACFLAKVNLDSFVVVSHHYFFGCCFRNWRYYPQLIVATTVDQRCSSNPMCMCWFESSIMVFINFAVTIENCNVKTTL